MEVAALCAGYGGLELGLRLSGAPVNVAWYSETSPAANRPAEPPEKIGNFLRFFGRKGSNP